MSFYELFQFCQKRLKPFIVQAELLLLMIYNLVKSKCDEKNQIQSMQKVPEIHLVSFWLVAIQSSKPYSTTVQNYYYSCPTKTGNYFWPSFALEYFSFHTAFEKGPLHMVKKPADSKQNGFLSFTDCIDSTPICCNSASHSLDIIWDQPKICSSSSSSLLENTQTCSKKKIL